MIVTAILIHDTWLCAAINNHLMHVSFFFVIIFCNFYDEGVLIKINLETHANPHIWPRWSKGRGTE